MNIEQRTIADIMLRWPDAAAVLEARGLDTCCGGIHTLKEAADAHAIPVGDLVVALQAAGVTDDMDADGGPVLDVRPLVPRERHARIFAMFEGLPVGGSFTLVNDHDPKPLYYQFQAERPGQVTWEPEEQGPERWAVRIGRRA